jgi:hypothetical protein
MLFFIYPCQIIPDAEVGAPLQAEVLLVRDLESSDEHAVLPHGIEKLEKIFLA